MISISSPVDKKQQNRLTALTEFATRCAAAGFVVPTRDDISAIAGDPDNWRSAVNPQIVAAWSAGIDELLLQVRFGTNPISANDFLADELKRPAIDIAFPPAGSGAESAPELAPVDESNRRERLTGELIRWRDTLIAKGVDGAEAIKDVTLSRLVKVNQTDADQIGRILPGPAAALAGQIAALMSRFEDGSAGPHGSEPKSTGIIEVFDAVPTQLDSDALTQAFRVVSTESEPLTQAFGVVAAESEPLTQAFRVVAAESDSAPRHASDDGPAEQPPAVSSSIDVPDRPPSRHSQPDSALLNLGHADFCDYGYEESEFNPGQIQFKRLPSGALRLSFDPYAAAGKTVIYRVVSGEDQPPYMPEAGDLVAVSTGLMVDDSRYQASAVRHYQVWCHVGVDLKDARRAQPFLLAAGEQVSPIEDLALREIEGRVTGTWTVFPGTRRVRVYRIPLSDAVPGNVRNDAHNEICTDSDNLTGFVDNTAVRGQRYLYRVFAEVAVGDSHRLSSPTQQPILVSVVLQAVSDLHAATIEGSFREFNLTWSTPDIGEVRVYWFQTPPKGGLENLLLDEAALSVQEVKEESRIPHPVIAGPSGTSQLRGVPWPANWQRLYLVPVTVHNGKAQVGRIEIANRPLPPVAGARIVERFDTEIATFGWPAGASAVKAFVGPESLSPEEICNSPKPLAEISRANYLRDGGLILKECLTPTGCVVYLMGVGYSGAQEIRGQIVPISYPGLNRVYYDLAVDESGNHAAIFIGAQSDVEMPPSLVLINNPERFPLSPEDGRHVPMVDQAGGQGQPVAVCTLGRIPRIPGHGGANGGSLADTRWRVNLTNVTGFLRMFFYSPPAGQPLALKDPDPRARPGWCGLYRDPTAGRAQ